MLIRLLLLAVCFGIAAFGQVGVQISDLPVKESTEELFYRDGSSNTEYICTARGTQPTADVWTRSASTSRQQNAPATLGQGTLTSIVVLTNVATVTTSVAHGYAVGHWVTVSGATVDTDLNNSAASGRYKIASVPNGTTFTFATSSVADATYTESTLSLSSTAPRTNALVWAIRKMFYTSTSIDRSAPAQGSLAMDKSCDSRTSYF
jgi:hypothetical protein